MVEGYVGFAEVMAAEQAQVDKEIARKGEFYNDNWRQLKRQLKSIRGGDVLFGKQKYARGRATWV